MLTRPSKAGGPTSKKKKMRGPSAMRCMPTPAYIMHSPAHIISSTHDLTINYYKVSITTITKRILLFEAGNTGITHALKVSLVAQDL